MCRDIEKGDFHYLFSSSPSKPETLLKKKKKKNPLKILMNSAVNMNLLCRQLIFGLNNLPSLQYSPVNMLDCQHTLTRIPPSWIGFLLQ